MFQTALQVESKRSMLGVATPEPELLRCSYPWPSIYITSGTKDGFEGMPHLFVPLPL